MHDLGDVLAGLSTFCGEEPLDTPPISGVDAAKDDVGRGCGQAEASSLEALSEADKGAEKSEKLMIGGSRLMAWISFAEVLYPPLHHPEQEHIQSA